jgi:hypothetical protein
MARIRTIKPEFFDDEKLATCSRDARLTFVGILSQSDDYGVSKGAPAWLRARIFPYDDDVTNTEMCAWIDELERIGVVRRFSTDGETFIAVRNWSRHQKVERPSATRNPETPETLWNEHFAEHSPRAHRGLTEDSPSPRAKSGRDQDLGSRIKDQDQEEVLPGAPAPDLPPAPEPEVPPFITLTTNTGSEFPIRVSQVTEFEELYPNVDVPQQLRNMRGWLMNNHRKRKTQSGMLRFVNDWLKREQDNPRSNGRNGRNIGFVDSNPEHTAGVMQRFGQV